MPCEIKKPWETTSHHKTNTEWGIRPHEQNATLQEALKPYLSHGDLEKVMNIDNHQTALLYLQSHHIKKLKDQGIIW